MRKGLALTVGEISRALGLRGARLRGDPDVHAGLRRARAACRASRPVRRRAESGCTRSRASRWRTTSRGCGAAHGSPLPATRRSRSPPASRTTVCRWASSSSSIRRRRRRRLRGSDVPGEFRPLTDALHASSLRSPSSGSRRTRDFEQGTGHFHDQIEEIYIVTRGTLTMRFGDDVHGGGAGRSCASPPHTARSHRNEGDDDGGDVGRLAPARPRRRHQDRRLLGSLARRSAASRRPCVTRRVAERPVRLVSTASHDGP